MLGAQPVLDPITPACVKETGLVNFIFALTSESPNMQFSGSVIEQMKSYPLRHVEQTQMLSACLSTVLTFVPQY
jgi:hypothetical protein